MAIAEERIPDRGLKPVTASRCSLFIPIAEERIPDRGLKRDATGGAGVLVELQRNEFPTGV